MYKVMKNGTEIRSYKSLATAKKIAEKEHAEVWKDGECVYTDIDQNNVLDEETAANEAPEQTEAVPYRLKNTMNVRTAPSMDASIFTVLPNKTTVNVIGIENDWMRLEGDLYILFGEGKYAEKI